MRIRHFLEHLTRDEMEELLVDVHVLLRPGGELEVVTPYYLSVHAAAGDHKNVFSERSMDCFTVDHGFPTPKPDLFVLEETELVFNDRKWVGLLRVFIPDFLVKNVPNAVKEVRFLLRKPG